MIYDSADAAVKRMNRQNIRLFGTLKLAKFDEITLVRLVGEAYDRSAANARQNYYEMAVDAYIAALMLCGIEGKKAARMADSIDRDWILDMLEEVDDITLYRFTEETDRKKQRLIEALTKALDKNEQVDKALRAWTGQIAQYAINTVDRARLKAFKDAGVEFVRWNSEHDERRCEECRDMDGEIYEIDKVPRKPHPRCRCWLTPVFDDSHDRLTYKRPVKVMEDALI